MGCFAPWSVDGGGGWRVPSFRLAGIRDGIERSPKPDAVIEGDSGNRAVSLKQTPSRPEGTALGEA
jgi:hypothetical protein